jgi:hypothetical protein
MAVKSWHILALAGSIVFLALVLALKDRYHYQPSNIDGRIGRIDRYTGAIEVYDQKTGWTDVRSR